MDELTLHEDPISGNCYKIVLTASLTGVPLARCSYSIAKGETRTPDFLRHVSRAGQIPVLQVGPATFIPESNAACFFIADNNDNKDEDAKASLIPADRLQRAQMLRWMFFEQNQHETSVAVLRSWTKLIGVENVGEERRAQIAAKRQQGEAALDVVEARLKESAGGFLLNCGMTLADVCLYAFTHVAHEGGLTWAGGHALGIGVGGSRVWSGL
jgi:glutathione S-transferase